MTAWKGLYNTILKELWFPLKCEHTPACFRRCGALSKAASKGGTGGRESLKTWLFPAETKSPKMDFPEAALGGQAVTPRWHAYSVPGKMLF